MPKFSFDFSVTAESPEQAHKKMQALTAIASYFSVKELEKLVDVINKEPHKIAIGKAYLGL